MGTQISEKELRDIVAKVLSNMQGGAPAAKAKWSAAGYDGRAYVGVFKDMNQAFSLGVIRTLERIYPLIVLVHRVVGVLVVHPQGREREADEAGGEAEHGDGGLRGVFAQVAQGYFDVV